MHKQAHRAAASLGALVLLAVSAQAAEVATSQQTQRLQAGPFRITFTDTSPTQIEVAGQPVIRGFYVYTAVPAPAGGWDEGFNFRRNEDGFRRQTHSGTGDSQSLVWSNKRWRYDGGRRGALAGELTVTLTVSGSELLLRTQGRIEPATGFGEVGFLIPEATFTEGRTATCSGESLDGRPFVGDLPWPEGARDIAHGLKTLTLTSPSGNTYRYAIEGQRFEGSHGLHFQDFRRQDTTLGCYRLVVNFDTAHGNDVDLTFRLNVTRAGKVTATVATPAPVAEAPALVPAPAGVLLSPVRTRAPAPASAPRLAVAVDPRGGVIISDRGVPVIRDDYFSLFPVGPFAREERDESGAKTWLLTAESEHGRLVKEVTLLPGEAWLTWTVEARREVQGEVGFYCPAEGLPSPCITYRSLNQMMVETQPCPEFGAAYAVIAGPEADPREFQWSTLPGADWTLQDFRARGERYRVVTTPRLQKGAVWRAALRYATGGAEPYPAVSFDQARAERGIIGSLLAEAVQDGFTVVPARATRYVLTRRPLTVRFKVYTRDTTRRAIAINYRIVDMWGRQVREASLNVDSGAGPFAVAEQDLTFDANGIYRMDIRCRSGAVLQTRELVLAVLPEVPDTGLRPDSVFGGALAGGDFNGALAQRIGIKWNRCHCAIGDTQAGAIQPTRGAFDWTRIDAACDFHERYGFLALHSISEGWLATWLTELWKTGDRKAYLDAYINEYVRPLATRYRGRIHYWEVTNEPYYQFRDCPEVWVELLKRTYATLKEVDPECTVVGTCGPPGSMGYAWYRRTFALGALDYQDGVSAHLYHFGPWVGSGVAVTVRKWMQDIRAIMRENGRVVPLWDTETTVSPPASMYRHPSHTRYIRYPAGESPSDPVEQAQTYAKVLIVHKAERVPYSFHIFHGGTEYTSHTGEYDETPLSMLAAQATLAKTLETAEFAGDAALHPALAVFLFRDGGRLTLIPWGPQFLKQDHARVRLALPAAAFASRDIFDNPLPVAGDATGVEMPVTWQAYYLSTDQISEDALRRALAEAQTQVSVLEPAPDVTRGHFGGAAARRAVRADWVGFEAIDLSAAANRSFTDEEPADGRGGWTDEGTNDLRQLPTGDWLINDVPFRIITPQDNGGRSCIVLKGGVAATPSFPERVSLTVGKRLSRLHLLHTVTWGGQNYDAFRYVLHYRDGFREEIPVTCGRNVADWWALSDLPEALLAWEGPNSVRDRVRVWHLIHESTHPEGAQAVLDRIEIVSAGQRPIPVVIAITGVCSN